MKQSAKSMVLRPLYRQRIEKDRKKEDKEKLDKKDWMDEDCQHTDKVEEE